MKKISAVDMVLIVLFCVTFGTIDLRSMGLLDLLCVGSLSLWAVLFAVKLAVRA